MFVAIDTSRDQAVTGVDIRDSEAQQAAQAESAYRCLFCEASLTYTKSPDGPFGYFTHVTGGSCVNDGNISTTHRLAQEMVGKRIVNLLPTDHDLIQIDLERQIGVESAFIIADVCVTVPTNLAVEVVYLSAGLDLERRLRTLFRQGYVGMIIAVTGGVLSPERINHYLGRISDIQVGQFDPRTLELSVGSVVTPDRVNLGSSRWDQIPACLS